MSHKAFTHIFITKFTFNKNMSSLKFDLKSVHFTNSPYFWTGNVLATATANSATVSEWGRSRFPQSTKTNSTTTHDRGNCSASVASKMSCSRACDTSRRFES
uniref:Uncharacterized protein n=1 Tax=Photinus pyralis TaxID=7054 RepID=A0A1Y1N5I6_PHOPY